VIDEVGLEKTFIMPNLRQLIKKPIYRSAHIGEVSGYNQAVKDLNSQKKELIKKLGLK